MIHNMHMLHNGRSAGWSYTGGVITTGKPIADASLTGLRHRAAWRQLAGHGAVVALFVLLAVVCLRPLGWQMADHVTGPGDPLTTAWRLAWPAQWLAHRPAPFWETNVLYPASRTFARDELTLGDSLI